MINVRAYRYCQHFNVNSGVTNGRETLADIQNAVGAVNGEIPQISIGNTRAPWYI